MHRPVLAALFACCSVAFAQTARPQTPSAPFPYFTEDVTIPAADGAEHTLAGTLSVPEASVWGDGPHPAIVLVTGSGPQDRDETIMGHKPFAVLADHLTRRGIAVLRYDDRGVGQSTGSFAGTTVSGLASDARAAWSFLRDHPATDPARVGIGGHSEGGVIAPMVAADEPGVAFVVMLAGTGVPGSEVLLFQSEFMMRAGGLDDDFIGKNQAIRRAIFELVHEGADDDTVLREVERLMDMELAYMKDPEARRRMARQALPQFTGAWAREFLTIDPADALSRVAVPVLALNGTLDTQVDADQNLVPIERALAAGPCPSATVVRLKNLNHLFQPAQTGMFGEYGAIETTFDAAAMGLISGWISSVTGVQPPAGE